ncbi:hypothetical protein HGA64_01630 [Candidatus Falkowbacteria bacterium]|nr:hypothetical protein [Candidatus Falkowbacteria bacterium]
MEPNNVMRYCGRCYKSLLPSEKSCPDGCDASIVTQEPITPGKEIEPAIGLATENPPPYYGDFDRRRPRR